ncbi:alpha-ketoacid dehydrogenase subunit alpha/beta [Niabella terrae]
MLQIYKRLLYPRLIEEKMLLLLRQGRISKWFSGMGQEAIAVGATLALNPEEWIFPLHRNLGVFTTRDIPLHRLFLQWQGDPGGFSKGRERSFHFGSTEHHICGMISHLGPQLALACGTALAARISGRQQVALAFSGEGGTSEGDFHEAMNLAAVWGLPVIFLIENNGYGLSTPVEQQYRCEQLSDKAKGYGMEGVTIDGNNILTVIDTLTGVRDYCLRHQQPYLVECRTFRMRGHEEASGTKYVPAELLQYWRARDPVNRYEQYLEELGLLRDVDSKSIRKELSRRVDAELEEASKKASPIRVDTEQELGDVYAPVDSAAGSEPPVSGPTQDLRFVDAVRQGLYQAMEADPRLILMGQDIAEYGGAFKVTEGFLDAFGPQRVRNTPICESAVVGLGLGLSLEGYKAVIEMQFADFVTMAFNQIVNNLAKIHYRWGQRADLVIRMPAGGGMGAGPFHSQSPEAWFAHVPGLKILYPSDPADAKGLLMAAINDPGPVLFFEHKGLYRSLSAAVPEAAYSLPMGRARKLISGDDASVITYGMGVLWAEEYAAAHPEVSLEIIDLRSLLPLDYDAIRQTVQKTGRVLILHEDSLFMGLGAEIAAWIATHCFTMLDAPVMRCGGLDSPIPFNKELEANYMAHARLEQTLTRLLNF